MRDAFRNVGIEEKDIRDGLKDMAGSMPILADAFARFGGTPEGLAEFRQFLGRGMSQLVPALKQGADGVQKLYEEAAKTHSVLDKVTAERLE
jgi:phage tail tape-measure protein